MDKELRNTLRNTVTKCRKLLEEAIGELLQGQFGIHADGKIEDASRLTHLSSDELRYREEVLAHLEHIKASGLKPNDATAQLIRETTFTHLNRLCAYKMMAERGLMQDPVGRGLKSRGFLFYLADHPEDETLYNASQEDLAFRHYLDWINESFALEIGVLFAREDVATPLFPPHRVIEEVLELINSPKLQLVWAQDETIGWIFQYFTPKELRDKARKESAAPRNSYEMSFRNQFFTPRYVVEFLVDNTLGRTWYEMRDGKTSLAEKCRYLALNTSSDAQGANGERISNLIQRTKKDPRDIKVLDPACGSGHFLLYCFDLFLTIYEEAYFDSDLSVKLQQEFPNVDEFKRQIPQLILAHNLHGIDIDRRVIQLAALALWLRAQRAFHEMGLRSDRPRITKTNLVCTEPMPGEQDLFDEFINQLAPHPLAKLIGDLLRKVFDRMKLAGEAGALVRIEDDIREPIEEARKQWQESLRETAKREEDLARRGVLFDYEKERQQRRLVFDPADITDERVWNEAEVEVVSALRDYARQATNGRGLSRRLFAEDAEQGFAFIDLCRQKFDVVLMNPPFGDASIPSKPYIDETYGDTKGDVYKAFVECFEDRLFPGGLLGIISSRTGFFLSGSVNWRERIVLRLFRPLVLADFGIGVLDAMVETAAYVLRSLTEKEDRQMTLQLAKSLRQVPTDRKGLFSTKRYEDSFGLRRHQAERELRLLHGAGFIKHVAGSFPRWMPLEGEIAKAEPKVAPYPPLVCLRLLGEEDKGRALSESLNDQFDSRRFVASPEYFGQVPNTPFCYWASEEVLSLFRTLEPFGSHSRKVQVGLSTKDDFRFVRLWWEVPPKDVAPPQTHSHRWQGQYCAVSGKWARYAKGGAFSPYYSDVHLLVNWFRSGVEIEALVLARYPYLNGNADWVLHRECDYFRPGITWTSRTTSNLSFRILQSGTVFSVKGPCLFSEQLEAWLPVLQSSMFSFLVSLQLGAADGAARSYEIGLIQKTPVPHLSEWASSKLPDLAGKIWATKYLLDTDNETSHAFTSTSLAQADGESLREGFTKWQNRVDKAAALVTDLQKQVDDIAFGLYGVRDEDRRIIEEPVSPKLPSVTDSEAIDPDDEREEENFRDVQQLTADLISYVVGCAFGRWDVRFATGARPMPEIPDPFVALPICARGALSGSDGLPLEAPPPDYPLRADSSGILVDDPEHGEDLVTRSREVFDLIWTKSSEQREREAYELLAAKSLRDYFRKPAAGGFWTDHVKRYSKSRRKAPIYWYLRSSKGNYGLWLYYHRLGKDTYHKARVYCVEPKLRLEQNNLAQLSKLPETAGRGAKQLERELEKQESFISELRDFHDKLKRVADLNLEPDLNDGVVLNVAPLWELVPWKEAEKYWKELIAGKYEWSSIAKQLRERGLVKAMNLAEQ